LDALDPGAVNRADTPVQTTAKVSVPLTETILRAFPLRSMGSKFFCRWDSQLAGIHCQNPPAIAVDVA